MIRNGSKLVLKIVFDNSLSLLWYMQKVFVIAVVYMFCLLVSILMCIDSYLGLFKKYVTQTSDFSTHPSSLLRHRITHPALPNIRALDISPTKRKYIHISKGATNLKSKFIGHIEYVLTSLTDSNKGS